MVYRITKRGGEEGEGDIRKQQDDPVIETRHDIIPLKFLRRAASDSRSEKQRLSSSLIVITLLCIISRPFLFLRTGLFDGARSSYEY